MDSRAISRTSGVWAVICLTLAVSAVGFSPAAHGATIYSTGFEAPTYTLGTLAGQDGWIDAGNPTHISVENTLAASGTQAVQFSTTGAVGQMGAAHIDPFNTGGSDALSISVDMRRASGGTASTGADLAVFDSTFTDVAFVRWAANNDLQVFGTTSVDLAGLLTPDKWNNIRLDLNYSTHTLDAALNGTVVASGIGFGGNDTFEAGGIFVQGPGTDNIFFDNFAVATTPLPSSLAAGLVLGGIGLAGQLRRRVRG